jgi:MarR family 2-MHQ and catechol resistance regulon transcriptional repressor
VSAQNQGQKAASTPQNKIDSVSTAKRRTGKPLPEDSAIFRFMKAMGPEPVDGDTGACGEPDLDGGIYCSIMVLNSVIERMGNRTLEPHELTLPQWLALGTVLHSGPEGVPHAQLGQRLMLSKAPVTGVVDRLERVGLVERRPDAKDRRISRVVGTKLGFDKWHEVKTTLHEKTDPDLDSCLTETEQNQLLHLLGRLLESFAPKDEAVAELIARK